MIYKRSYWKHELKLSYVEQAKSRRYLITLPLLLAVATISIHRLLMLLNGSVLAMKLSFLMRASSFSIFGLYRIITCIFFTVWFILNYSTVTFSEISTNRWYLLRKMKKSAEAIVTVNVLANIGILLFEYTLGFVASWLLGGAIGNSTHRDSILPMFISGVWQLLIITTFFMFISLIFPRKQDAATLTVIGALVVVIICYNGKYYKLIHSVPTMSDVHYIVSSPVFILGIVTFAGFLIASILIAYFRSGIYTPCRVKSIDMIMNYKTKKLKKISTMTIIPDAIYKVLKIVFVVCLFSMFAVSILIFILSSQTSNHEFSVLGYIPYNVESDLLQGTVEPYDFALFKHYKSEEIKPGDVILYSDMGAADIAIVKEIGTETEIGKETLTVGIYDSTLEPDHTINKFDINGLMVFKSSFVGGLLILIQSNIGTVLFIGGPLVIVCFYDEFEKLLKRLKATSNRFE